MEFIHKTSEYVYVYIWGANRFLYLGSSCISRVNIYIWNSSILQANISISSQFLHIAGEYIYIWNSFILQANISISCQFMHIAGEYVYIYMDKTFIWISAPYYSCFGDARC